MITQKDYFDFRGINLDIELKGGATDNATRAVEIYLERITDFVLAYIDENFTKPEYEVVPHDEVLKKVMLYQVEYQLLHGNITVSNLDNISLLSPNGKRVLRNAGYNHFGIRSLRGGFSGR